MPFRDDREAFRARADQLESDLEQAKAELERLRAASEHVETPARLGAAEAELRRLRRTKSRSRIAPIAAGAAFILALGAWLFYARQGSPVVSSTIRDPLRRAGISPAAESELFQLGIDDLETDQIVAMRRAGASDETCVALIRDARSERRRVFVDGDPVVQLRRAGMADRAILTLSELDLLRPWAEHAVSMRASGASDETILALARVFRAQRGEALTGFGAARLLHAGVRESAVIELARLGVGDSEVHGLVGERQRGASDEEIVGPIAARARSSEE